MHELISKSRPAQVHSQFTRVRGASLITQGSFGPRTLAVMSALLTVYRALCLLVAGFDACLACVVVTPTLRSLIPNAFLFLFNAAPRSTFHLAAWALMLNSIVRMHAGVWPREKVSYRCVVRKAPGLRKTKHPMRLSCQQHA
jgi:hypothetical protein